jgi:hypothetical protein
MDAFYFNGGVEEQHILTTERILNFDNNIKHWNRLSSKQNHIFL